MIMWRFPHHFTLIYSSSGNFLCLHWDAQTNCITHLLSPPLCSSSSQGSIEIVCPCGASCVMPLVGLPTRSQAALWASSSRSTCWMWLRWLTRCIEKQEHYKSEITLKTHLPCMCLWLNFYFVISLFCLSSIYLFCRIQVGDLGVSLCFFPRSHTYRLASSQRIVFTIVSLGFL